MTSFFNIFISKMPSRSAIILKRYKNKIIFYAIKGSTIKKFIVFDLVTGTGIYYLLKAFFFKCNSCINW